MQHALDHLGKALTNVSLLPAPPMEHHLEMLNNALLDLQISKALMTVAVAASTLSVQV